MKESFRQKVDPPNTGKITFEGWQILVLFGYYKHKLSNGNIWIFNLLIKKFNEL